MLTINDADQSSNLETPVTLKIVVFKSIMLIFAEDELYCIEQVFKQDLEFSQFPSKQMRNKFKSKLGPKVKQPKMRIEIGHEHGCTPIETIFHKILEAIFSRLETLIIKMSNEANECLNCCNEYGLGERIQFIVTLALSMKNLIYLEEVISPKAKLFEDLLDCTFLSKYIKFYLRSLESRTRILMEQIKNNKVLVKTAEKIYSQSIENDLVVSSENLNNTTKFFSSINTMFLPINLIAALMGMNVEVPWQYYVGYEPFIVIVTGSFIIFLSTVIFFKSKGWM